ncbi:MAG: LysM peptidoglycan-binding domain-containing protein, partial [Pseudomonadota bacterium]
ESATPEQDVIFDRLTPSEEGAAAKNGQDVLSVYRSQPIAAGVYALRVDQINAVGAVTSRIETPFQREAIAEGPLGDNVLTVQRGDNLWRIAEATYGDGPRYTLIFAANEAQIRDPDLIYPGQIFTLPDAPRR